MVGISIDRAALPASAHRQYGGIAPGLNPVTTAIVRSHVARYHFLGAVDVFYARGGFKPIVDYSLTGTEYLRGPLTPNIVAPWIGQGGSNIGIDRFLFTPRELAHYIQGRRQELDAKWEAINESRFDQEVRQ